MGREGGTGGWDRRVGKPGRVGKPRRVGKSGRVGKPVMLPWNSNIKTDLDQQMSN